MVTPPSRIAKLITQTDILEMFIVCALLLVSFLLGQVSMSDKPARQDIPDTAITATQSQNLSPISALVVNEVEVEVDVTPIPVTEINALSLYLMQPNASSPQLSPTPIGKVVAFRLRVASQALTYDVGHIAEKMPEKMQEKVSEKLSEAQTK